MAFSRKKLFALLAFLMLLGLGVTLFQTYAEEMRKSGVKMSEKSGVVGKIIFRDENTWDWIADPIEIGEVEVGMKIDTEQYAPEYWRYVNEKLKNYQVVLDDLKYLKENGKTWVLDVPMKRVATEKIENGVMLDIARKFYSPDVIKQYIDLLSGKEHSFLQLHISDDENFAVESELLGQMVENATFLNGVYKNIATGKSFLSKEQLRELVSYAKEKRCRTCARDRCAKSCDSFAQSLSKKRVVCCGSSCVVG
ncbi:Glycosyl hydrolase family 20, catalytic domain [Pilibacter termitis]|uniref:Glycosyl hydrolase family 20, catalytic domain n=1 Tax=Pilibacter termitis TaxID=263852 RepID=A0A1T4M367_9ENTE|nr:family 20 glycosylhydrolase [Pilibacter termitis]SJZ61439.1 Glycosyl hydrolase family 20, catalytic domain [Pilibacter termitis]